MAHEFGKNIGGEEREQRGGGEGGNGLAIQAYSTFNAELRKKKKSKQG